jgi:stage II sporulation protein D
MIIIPSLIALQINIQKQENNLTRIVNTKIRVKRKEKNKIEEVELEEYVEGVVSAEMPISFDIEALKAQAVCARSYAIRKINQNQKKDYDVVDTIENQVYLDEEERKAKWKDKYDEYSQKLKQIIEETKGEYMTYEGKVIETFFFSTSNGKTENSEEVFTKSLPYLRSVDSSWDEEVSPVFYSQQTFSFLDFYTKLSLPYNENLNIQITERTTAGSVKTIKINDTEMKGTKLRTLLNLKSTYFTVDIKDQTITFNTQGNGHGVGMSQYGALAMAKKGYKYDEILKYYYQGIEISKL